MLIQSKVPGASKRNLPDFLRYDGHDQLVRERAHEEGNKHGSSARDAPARYGGCVHVSQEEGVHGFVPFARELVPGCGVPPVFVELAIGEAIKNK